MAQPKKVSTEELLSQLQDLLAKAQANVRSTQDQKELEQERVRYLGRKSELTAILKNLKDISIEDRKQIGAAANSTRDSIAKLIDSRQASLIDESLSQIATTEWVDITEPAKGETNGHEHPIRQMQTYAEDIFMRMGFEIEYPYELDDDYHIFESLNFPKGHPARDSWDTFSTTDGHMPIPHTSAMQNRVMAARKPPIRVVVPGRCFRNEATDARHEHTFFQIEGVYVDKGITLAHLLGTLKAFFSEFYQRDIEVKFTPDFFPFVEPGGMMSLTCVLCDGKGCNVCKKTGWLEVLGCGMIHPNVLKEAGIDPEVYSGFAWGFGLERLIMLKYNIEDIRLFYSGNLKFVKQF